jgi:hypothetical protein
MIFLLVYLFFYENVSLIVNIEYRFYRFSSPFSGRSHDNFLILSSKGDMEMFNFSSLLIIVVFQAEPILIL